MWCVACTLSLVSVHHGHAPSCCTQSACLLAACASVCAAMCVRTDAELRDTFDDLVKFDMGFFQDNNCYAMMKQAIEKGHLHDMDTMIGKLRELLGDCTFAEAYERTGAQGGLGCARDSPSKHAD